MKDCTDCKFFNAFSGGCLAYPDGIPDRFAQNLIEHTEIEEDQTGEYTFEKGESHEFELLEDKNEN